MTAVADDYEEAHLPIDVSIESYDTLLLLMASKEPNVLMPTIAVLREKTSDESMVRTIIPRLVEIAHTFKDEQVLTVVSWYLSALATTATTSPWAFDVLSSSGSVSCVVSFAKQLDKPSISERCFDALVALSADPVTSREIISNGALDVFKEALKKEDPSIQSQVSLAIFRMSTDFENRRSILSSGLFDSLIDFLSAQDLDEEVLANALQAAGHILEDSECILHFEERQGWNSVFPFLDDTSVQIYAYPIIAHISSVKAFQFHFDDQLLTRFTTSLTDLEETDPVMPHLLTIFRNCAKLPIVSKSLSLQVPFLLDRMFSQQTDIKNKEIIAEIFAQLSTDANTHSALLEPEQLSRICKLLSKDFSCTIRKSAILVLDSICENKSIRSKLHEFGAVEQLVQIVHETVEGEKKEVKEESIENVDQSTKTETAVGWKIEFQMIVLPMIYKMIGDSKLQEILVEKSIADLEVLMASEYPDILNTSLLILATIATEENARNDIANRPQFLQNLIKLISNKKVAIRRNSLHAINSLSLHPRITAQFCNFGLIEKLRKFASSSSMINLNLAAFATTALETICTSNVIAKYWVKDVIDFDDALEDGFYSIDPRCECYKSVEDFLNDVIHMRLEILLLDKTKDEGLRQIINDLAESFTVKAETVESTQPKKRGGKKSEAVAEPQTTVVVPEWPHIAVSVSQFVVSRMGGPFEGGRIPYEAEISRCKYKTHSDVVMLGQLQVGTIRHRALMFKYLAALYGMQVEIKRNREDLNCEIRVRKGADVYTLNLTGVGEALVPTAKK